MKQELQDQFNRTAVLVKQYFLGKILERYNAQKELIQQIESLVAGHNGDPEESDLVKKYTKRTRYKLKLLQLVEEHFDHYHAQSFDEEYTEFKKHLSDYIRSLDAVIIRSQDEDRFISLASDSASLKFVKWFKRQFRSVSYWPAKSANVFRKWFKKELVPIQPWNHRINLQQLASYYLSEKLSFNLSACSQSYFEESSRIYQKLWRIDEVLDEIHKKTEVDDTIKIPSAESFKELYDQLDVALTKTEASINDILKTSFEDYEQHYVRCGTIEVSNFRYREGKIKSLNKRLNNHYFRLTKGWSNTFRALSDDWEIDIELYRIIYRSLQEYYTALNNLDVSIKTHSYVATGEIKAFINELKTKIQDQKENIKGFIGNELASMSESLESQYVNKATETILSQNYPAQLNSVEVIIANEINSITQKRAIVKNADFNKPIRSSAMSYISPDELINFESYPKLAREIGSLKMDLTSLLNRVQVTISQLTQIIQFNLQSAISINSEDTAVNDPQKVALEGLDRALGKLEEAEHGLADIPQLLDDKLLPTLRAFHDSLEELTDNENIYEIKLRIAKGMAILRGRRIRDKWIARIKNIIPTIWKFLTGTYKKADEGIKSVLKRIGVAKINESITTEVAGFLAKTESALAKLPFVYQRLFKNEPLTDSNLFVGRVNEKQQLINAYNDWSASHFAAAIVVGEKGSGITSLLNHYLHELGTANKVVCMLSESSISSTDEFIELLNSHLNQKFKSLDELANHLNSAPKKVIVLEKIQKLYQRKVGGFKAINILSELISMTGKNVFWVCSCSRYAWDYLNKTIQLEEHFSHHISLEEFDNKSIVDLIISRHQISGYYLEFQPPASYYNSKKFKSLNDNEQQELLKSEFFGDLNKIAKSNISLALIYWLRSTKEVSQTTIHIGSLKELNFSFINNLSVQKLQLLHILLLHDGLSETELTMVLGGSVHKTRNMVHPLFEDGIIVLQKHNYHINPLVYRQTVQVLKSKNILH